MASTKIMIVEDEYTSAQFLCHNLKKSGYEIASVLTSGEMAVQHAEDERPDIILMDIGLSGQMDGIEAAKQIHNRYDIPVIFLTAQEDREILERAKLATPFGYLIKPLNNKELTSTIEISLYRHKMEKRLQKSEEKYRTILESIEEGYFEVDIDGNFTFFNDPFCKILGYSNDELMGMNGRECTDPENEEAMLRVLSEVYATGIPNKSFDYEIIRKDGEKRHVTSSMSLIRDAENRPIGFRGIGRDITERKRTEELRQAKIEAEAANEAKSQFLANMSHEIRTPLNGILGMTELGLEAGPNDKQRDLFGIINKEANSLLRIINDILDFSKIEAGKLELDEIPFDIRVMLDDVAKGLAYRAAQKGLEIISFLSPDVPSRLIGDPGRLRQILTNLLGNALKFTSEGEIYVKVEKTESLGDGVKIRFSVKDTGTGIPEEKHATIFESFTQADGSTTREYGGTGLGTTISKQLAELMGGEIGLESAKGKGSTFWFTAIFKKQKSGEMIRNRTRDDLNDLKVLVADDNRTNRHVLVEYLKSWGCRPTEAQGGAETLSILKASICVKAPFDLVMIDSWMSDLNGFDLVAEIKKIDALKSVPILLMTSFGGRGDGKRCRELGIEGYVTKPVGQDQLRGIIGTMLGLSVHDEGQNTVPLITRHTIAEEDRKNTRILVVEDYATNQLVAKRYLQSAGYRVDLADNGQKAVRKYQKKQYDVILMDIQMPVMDGYGATKAIRNLETRSRETGQKNAQENPDRVPIIAMTAHAIKGYRERCLKAGMDDYISKPLKRAELVKLVDKWVTPGANYETEPGETGVRFYGGAVGEKPRDVESGVDEQNAPMNFDRAVVEFEGDKELLLEVLDGFLGDVRAQVETIHRGLSQGNAEVVWRQAHSIKGGAANLTAQDLSMVALELENIGKLGVLADGIDVMEKLEREFKRLETYAQGV